jgi:DNA-directed RNA polymerase sigma subunit (sigma70/sigma32)
MARSLSWIDSSSWPSDDGWPYDDDAAGPVDLSADADDDVVAIHALASHLLDRLEPLERQVVAARFGLDGQPARSMKQLSNELHQTRADLRVALGDGLAKLRSDLA